MGEASTAEYLLEKKLKIKKIESDYQRLEKRIEKIERIFGVGEETLDCIKEENDSTERSKGIRNGVNEKENSSISIQGIIETLKLFKVEIDKTVNEINNYLEISKEEIEEKPNETEEELIKRTRSISDRLGKMKRINGSNEKLTELFRKQNEFIVILRNEENRLANKHNELIDLARKKREEEEILNKLDIDEIQQLEEWSEMKIGNIIFDSDIDNWNQNTSVFDQIILNKSNLIFLIEDEDGNKFGGYINVRIDKYHSYIKDPKSFLFSLESNGRLNGMLKFDIKQSQHAFYLGNQSYDYLFLIGGNGCHDICIGKENNKSKSYCYQRSFEYDEIQNALCGKSYPQTFTPKRITIIQLI